MSYIEQIVANKIIERANFGLLKYGVGMDRTDLSVLQFLVHAQEEACDMAVYLERLIQEEELRLQQNTENNKIIVEEELKMNKEHDETI